VTKRTLSETEMAGMNEFCGTKFNLGNTTDRLLRQKSGCRNYIGRDTAVCIGRLLMVSDGVIGDISREYIHLSFITFCGGSSNMLKYAQRDISR